MTGQVHALLRVRHLVPAPRLVQYGEIEEAQGSNHLINSVARQLALADQMRGVLTNLPGSEVFGRLLEVAGQILESAQVGAHGTFGVVTARDFLARHFFVMGHRDLLVTRNLLRSIRKGYGLAHAKRLPIGLVQVAISETEILVHVSRVLVRARSLRAANLSKIL